MTLKRLINSNRDARWNWATLGYGFAIFTEMAAAGDDVWAILMGTMLILNAACIPWVLSQNTEGTQPSSA